MVRINATRVFVTFTYFVILIQHIMQHTNKEHNNDVSTAYFEGCTIIIFYYFFWQIKLLILLFSLIYSLSRLTNANLLRFALQAEDDRDFHPLVT